MTLAELNHRALAILIRELGTADTLRFANQFSPGAGDYAIDRQRQFAGGTLAEIVAEIKGTCPNGGSAPGGEVSIADAELGKIEARCGAATSGPWRSFVEGRDHLGGNDFIMTGGDERGPDIELIGATQADQDFIADARQDVPRLVAEVRRMRRISGESTGRT